MSELETRWRLVLGKYGNRRLPLNGMESGDIDGALGFLYDRVLEGRGFVDGGGSKDGDRTAGLEASAPRVVDWLDDVAELFPPDVMQDLTKEAIERFGLTELLTDERALERIEPDEATLRMLLSLKAGVQPAALAAVRRVVAQVVEDLSERLRREVERVIVGRIDRQSRTRRPSDAVDAKRTIEQNLGTWDAERQRLLIEEVRFFRRSKLRHPWEIILCVDQSGSMVGSVIHSAVLAGVLAGLPGVTVKLVVFDTSVVDLSDFTDDPVEVLMSVQLGGGTNIGQALTYCEQLVTQPSRTVVALVTDFFEGGPVDRLLASVGRLAEAGVTMMGLAALEDGAGPAFDHRTAELVAASGMPVAAMSPSAFAEWAAGVMQ